MTRHPPKRSPLLVRLLAFVAGVVAGLAAPAGAQAYGWPIKPFDRQHPVRGGFGDPRTVFWHEIGDSGLDGPGAFSFHNGVDIAAPGEPPVYPVQSGYAYSINNAAVAVRTGRGVTFQYFHVRPTRAWLGARVVARRTVLGYVLPAAAHVHLAEIVNGRIVNPLQPGHLRPFRDTTRPTVSEVELRGMNEQLVNPLAVTGPVSVVADAFDTPPVLVPGAFAGLPIAPQLFAWSLRMSTGRVAVPRTTTIDFRRTLPPPRDFWRVYARGSFQNFPTVGRRFFGGMPGRYLFRLTPKPLDTRLLYDGIYLLTVEASDARGNKTSFTERIRICNFDPACVEPPAKRMSSRLGAP